MRSMRPDKRFIFFLISVLIALGLTPFLFAAPSSTENTRKPFQDYKININKLHQEMTRHREQIAESGEEETNVLDELSAIDSKISQQKHKLTTLKSRLKSQEKLLVLKKKDFEQAEKNKEKGRLHLEKRLRSFYTMGKVGFLNVVFSTKDLPDLLFFNDSFMHLLEYDQSVVLMYRETLAELQRTRDSHELEKSLLNDFIASTATEQKKLNTSRQEKEKLLRRIKTEKSLYKQALREMKKAEKQLTAKLKSIKKKKIDEKRGFILNKGKLTAPLRGKIISRFGEKQDEETPGFNSTNGITIEPPDSVSEVFSIFSGKVLFSGYMRGYGNTIIIDHGLQYFTVTARLDSLAKKQNQRVATGELIGTTGDIATLFEKGLYFEIRQSSKPLDPMTWLDESSFK